MKSKSKKKPEVSEEFKQSMQNVCEFDDNTLEIRGDLIHAKLLVANESEIIEGNDALLDESIQINVENGKTKVIRKTKDDVIDSFIVEVSSNFDYTEREVANYLIKKLASKKSKTILKTYLDELLLKLYRGQITLKD